MRALATDIPMTDSRHAAVFIAGTDTGIGKTHASCTLLHALRDAGHRSCGMKPVASGCAATPDGLRNDDALALQAAGSDPALAYERINPVALRDPLSPHLAAAREHRQVTLAPMRAAFEQLRSEHSRVVVEGVGGWLVPLAPGLFASDSAKRKPRTWSRWASCCRRRAWACCRMACRRRRLPDDCTPPWRPSADLHVRRAGARA